MSLRSAIFREVEVAFSKQAQPIWFRVVKYILVIVLLYLFWDSSVLWIIVSASLTMSLLLHFWYRYKTAGWSRSYGGWKYRKR